MTSRLGCGSMDRAPARCLEGHGFDSRRYSDFSLTHARVVLIITDLKIHHYLFH